MGGGARETLLEEGGSFSFVCGVIGEELHPSVVRDLQQYSSTYIRIIDYTKVCCCSCVYI